MWHFIAFGGNIFYLAEGKVDFIAHRTEAHVKDGLELLFIR